MRADARLSAGAAHAAALMLGPPCDAAWPARPARPATACGKPGFAGLLHGIAPLRVPPAALGGPLRSSRRPPPPRRAKLLALGWRIDALRLAFCTVEGEGHAVMTADIDAGTLVDNRYDAPRPWTDLPYRWVSRQLGAAGCALPIGQRDCGLMLSKLNWAWAGRPTASGWKPEWVTSSARTLHLRKAKPAQKRTRYSQVRSRR